MRIKEITEEHILFDNGTKVTYYHDQDCCEHVYADFEQLKTTTVMNEDFPEHLEFEFIEDSGIKVKSYLIPCYNSQNGYYSSDLQLTVEYPDGHKEVWDISEYVKDDID